MPLLRQFLVLVFFGQLFCEITRASEAAWGRLSSENGQLPVPGNGKVQTAIAVGDFDKNRTNEFILGFADAAPALVLISKGTSWISTSVELEALPIAPGGIAMDVDHDDDLDVIFGTSRGAIYWWENPYPDFDPTKSWTRHLIKNADGGPIWGELVGDFRAGGDPQLVFWNQANSTLYAATIPREVRTNVAWPLSPIFTANPSGTIRPRGLSAADINIDGQTDLVAANYWLKLNDEKAFRPASIGEPDGIIATGRFNEGTYPQIVSTGGSRLTWFECRIDPDKSSSWGSHELLSERIGTLIIADLNRDDRDDILASTSGNLLEPTDTSAGNLTSSTWILYGDSKGNFKTTLLPVTNIWQTVSVADLNRDGGLDLIAFTGGTKPHLEIWLNESTPSTRPTAPLQRP